MTTSLLKPLALLVGASMLASGSAYAGATVAKDTVGSRQVIDNSLASRDLENAGVRAKDLAPGSAPRTYTFIGNVPAGETEVFRIPGFSRFEFSCSNSSIDVFVGFGDADPAPEDPWQQHGIAMSDLTDNQPVGAATITGYGGGVGFGYGAGPAPGSGIIIRGDYWGRASRLLAHGSISMGHPSVPCLVRVQVVVERLKRPDPLPVPRVARRGPACDATGAAFCESD